MTYEISDIGLDPDGTALITYMDDADVRCEGAVAVRHTVRVAATDQYREGIQALLTAAQRLVTDALDDWRDSPAVDLTGRAAGGVLQTPVPEHTGDEESDPHRQAQMAAIEASRDRSGS